MKILYIYNYKRVLPVPTLGNEGVAENEDTRDQEAKDDGVPTADCVEDGNDDGGARNLHNATQGDVNIRTETEGIPAHRQGEVRHSTHQIGDVDTHCDP